MKKSVSLSDKNLLSLLSNSSSKTVSRSAGHVCFYFSNRDGSIRWVYPQSLKSPTFLNFFSQSTFRSKFVRLLVAIIFYRNVYLANLSKKRRLVIDVAEDSILSDIINRRPDHNFSIFLGTVGENRKLIIEINDNVSSLSFIKIGVSDASKCLIDNEHKTLKLLGGIETKSFSVPSILNYRSGILETSNINTYGAYQSNKLMPIHYEALKEFSCISRSDRNYDDLILEFGIEEAIKNLEKLCRLGDHNNSIDLEQLIPKIKGIAELLRGDYFFSCSISHGDFTPWNIYVKPDGLGIIDWELSVDQVPLFFDFFHFLFQSEILLSKASYCSVKEEIYAALDCAGAKTIHGLFNVDINRHFIFYLLFNVTRYLGLYAKQETPHDQIYWMVSVWENAMDDVVSTNGKPLKCF